MKRTESYKAIRLALRAHTEEYKDMLLAFHSSRIAPKTRWFDKQPGTDAEKLARVHDWLATSPLSGTKQA